MDKVNINIQVGEFKHPLTVDPDEEPIYREAARLINERLTAYRTKFRDAKLPEEYLLSFAALDIATHYIRQRRSTNVAPVEEAIQALTAELEDFNQNR